MYHRLCSAHLHANMSLELQTPQVQRSALSPDRLQVRTYLSYAITLALLLSNSFSLVNISQRLRMS